MTAIKKFPTSATLTNHYVTRLPDLVDPPTRDSEIGPSIREQNLRVYLQGMFDRRPKYVWLFEAPSAKGAIRTGVPQIGESSLNKRAQQLGISLRRATSDTLPLMRDSDTSEFVWQHVQPECIPLFWNSIMWRPHEVGSIATTRTPSSEEIRFGAIILAMVVKTFEPIRVISVGRPAEKTAKICGLNAPYVRHPSMGGRAAFSVGIRPYTY